MELAEDLVQEVFIKVWEKRSTIRKNTVKNFLFTIANNLLMNHFNHMKVVRSYEGQEVQTGTRHAVSPQFILEEKEFEEELNRIIGELPESCRVVFLMNRMDKLKYEEIAERLELSVKAKVVSIKQRIFLVAASVSFLVLVGWFVLEDSANKVEFATLNGESKQIELPDGSKVYLNTQSSISYTDDWDRSLTLRGEAFFEVQKGMTFTVSTQAGSVEVLGTSFNVSSRLSEMTVACKTGKVRVNIPDKSYSGTIESGEMIQFLADTVKQLPLRIDVIGKWQTGEFYFQDQSIGRVMAEMMRQFDVTINAEGVGI